MRVNPRGLRRLTRTHRVSIYARQYGEGASRDKAGGEQYEWATIGRATTCLINPLSTRDQAILQQAGSQATHRLYFHENPACGAGDKIVYNSRVFIAESDPKNTLEMDLLWVVEAIEYEQTVG